MKAKYEHDLTQGHITSTLLRFALPFMASSLFQFLYAVVDMVIVGQFSDSAGITAVNNSGQVMQLVTGLICGVATGGTVLIGQHIGAKQDRQAGRTVGNMILLFAGLAALITALILWLGDGLVALMKVPGEAIPAAESYLRICGIGTVFIVGYNVVASILRGIGDSKRPMYFITISCVLNVLGDLLLVGGFHMGAAGAAIATVFAQAVSFITSLATLCRSGLPFPVEVRLEPGRLLRVLRVGIPVALQDMMATLSFIIITVVVNLIGLDQSAAVGVVERLIGFSMVVPIAFMSALSVFAAQNIGAGKPERAKRGMWVSMGVSLLLTLLLEGVFGLLWGVKGRGDWLLLLAVNVVTNPIVVTLHYCVSRFWGFTLFLELAAVAAEWLAYRRWGRSTDPALIFSVCANCFSYFTGVILNLLPGVISGGM